MSYRSFSVIPDENDLSGFFGVAGKLDSSGIVALLVAERVTVQFQPEDHEFAVRYLTKLADEALALAQQVAEANPEQQS